MFRTIAVGLTLLLYGCSTSCLDCEFPALRDPILPVAIKPYDPTRGGVQITHIYYRQDVNRDSAGVEDEWIDLQAQGWNNTTGWTLSVGDGRVFALPSEVNTALEIYTVSVPDRIPRPTFALGLQRGDWVWADSGADTARIIDAQGNVVDELAYTGK